MENKSPRNHQIGALKAINTFNEGIIHLPTGSGKTFIQALSIAGSIDKGAEWVGEHDIPVFTILAPRILLSDQLFNEVRNILASMKKDCQYLIVHSGNTEDKSDTWAHSLPYRQIQSTTKVSVIKTEYEKARAEKVPLIIIGTYDSAERIMQAEIPVYMTSCDEAQYLVSEEFHYIALENKDPFTKQFQSHRKYYYTATLKVTASDKGMGMNNEDDFGQVIYSKTPLELIHSGEIVRPRIHLVNTIDNSFADEVDKDATAITESFREHLVNVNTGAKLLVVTKGSEHLNDIVNHPKIKTLRMIRPNLKIFDISSAYHPRINGSIVTREDFLAEMQGLTDQDEAIIFHVRILAEGIDVPGITGIMPMGSLGLSTFLQTLGRASRLHPGDRKRLYGFEIKASETDLMIKPYAWIIMPIYGIIEEDDRVRMTDIIYALRDHGFKAAEDVFVKISRGKAIPEALGGVNEKDEAKKKLIDTFIEIEHTIEEQEIADALALEKFRLVQTIEKENIEDTLKRFVTF
jgi:superfamily II DNA or RNA helicase